MLKTFVQSIDAVFESLSGVCPDGLLANIKENCRPERIWRSLELIHEVINDDVTYQKTPLDLRNQRTYAVKVINHDPEKKKCLHFPGGGKRPS